MRVGEQFLVRGEVFKSEVCRLDHTELLKVRVRVPPAATLIEPDAISERLSKRALRLLQVESAQRGLEQPFGTDRLVRPVEAERSLLGYAQGVAADPVRAGILQSAEKTRADEANEDEVVEMAGLERGVLTIVGETEKLPRVLAQPGFGAMHPAQNAADEHSGRGGAAFG